MEHNTEVVTKEQHDQIERVLQFYQGCRGAVETLAAYKFLAGAELLGLKDGCQHGQFEKVKAEILVERGMSRSAQGRCLKFAQDVRAKYPTVGYLTPTRLLTNGKLDERGVEKIAEFFRDEMDGKGITSFCRDIGAIRDKKPAAYHPPKMTAAQKEKAAQESAEAVVEQMLTQVRLVLNNVKLDGSLVSRISRPKWKETSQLLVALNKEIQPLCKRAGRSAASQAQ